MLITLAQKRWAPFAVAWLVALPSLGAGFVLDDWLQRALLRGDFRQGSSVLALFTFADGDPSHTLPEIRNGPFPWFTLPEVRLSFFRPLASLLTYFDFHVFGDHAWLAHLHSILWYLALVGVVTALYRRVLGPLASLAALAFALDDAHTFPVDWLANRNAIIATTFAWLGLWAHLRWREDGWAHGRWLSVLGFVTGLSSGEVTIAASAYLVSYELIARSADSRRTRALALLPTFVALLGFVVLYRAMHAGAYGSATYIDPLSEPLAYLQAAPARFFGMVGAWSFGLLQEVWLFLPPARPVLIASGALTVLLAPLGWRWVIRAVSPAAPPRTILWLTVGSVGAILPGLATFPSSRLLTAPSFGLCALVAVLANVAWQSRSKWASKAVLAYSTLNFVVHPLIFWSVTPYALCALGTLVTEGTAIKPNPPLTGKVVVLSAGDFLPTFYAGPLLAETHRPFPEAWLVLSLAPYAHRVTMTSEDTFELEVLEGAMLGTVFEQIVRSASHPLRAGSRVELQDLDIVVLADDDGRPSKLRVHLHLPQRAFQWVRWDGWQFQPAVLPEVGQTLELPKVPSSVEALFTRP